MNRILKSIDITLRARQLPVINTERLVLKDIGPDDVTPDYVNWLNDVETNKFLEIRLIKHNLESVRQFCVEKLKHPETSMHFGIFLKHPVTLIGTITLPHINLYHQFADISFVVGHPSAKNKGFATEALSGVIHYIFNHTSVVKLYAGHYDGHVASHNVLKKVGFEIEGRIRKKLVRFDGKRVDHIYMGLLKEEYHSPFVENIQAL